MKSLQQIHRNIRKKTNRKGFTFIELLAVFAIMAILTSLSIAGFSKFNQSKSFDNSVNDVATMLSTARSRSLSQVKKCPAGNLNGYLVTVQNTGPAPYKYELDYVCNGVATPVDTEYLPNTVQFTSGSMCNTLYTTMTGTTSPTGSITIKDTVSGKQSYLTISSTGTITKHTGAGPSSPCLTLSQLIGSSGPPPPMDLGGIDLTGYCTSIGYSAALLVGSTWNCFKPIFVLTPINLTSACQWQYPTKTITSVTETVPGDPMTYQCYGY